jgi:hypothetical protein
MANFVIPYTNAADYTYDPVKIAVSGGNATLRENRTNVHLRYHLNETSGILVTDSSGNNRTGAANGVIAWVAGKLNNCLRFDGTSTFINADGVANFEYTQPFSIEFWFRSTAAGSVQYIIGKQATSTTAGFRFSVASSNLQFWIGATGTNRIQKTGPAGTCDGLWHHVVGTYDGSANINGMLIYMDNVLQVTTNAGTNITASILNTANLYIGMTNNEAQEFNGDLDEITVYDRVITPAEISYRYNLGSGRENFIYYNDSPSIYRTIGFSDLVLLYTNFSETLGVGNQGSVAYQLSTDAITWQYWNGAAWVVAGALNYNSAAVVNANISSFPVLQPIYARAFLISSAQQLVVIDENQIGYSINNQPIVYAGTDKTCFDNQTISPFSDCTFMDSDGTITSAYYQVDGEVVVWTEIFQGGYGTLQEAVRAFTYQYNNLGGIITRLRVMDNGGRTADDDLTVTVSKMNVTFNVRDTVGSHVMQFTVIADDGAGPQIKDSPFAYALSAGNHYIDILKTSYNVVTELITVTANGQVVNITIGRPLTTSDIDLIWNHAKALSVGKFLALK